MLHLNRQKKQSHGKRKKVLKICVEIPGVGNRKIHPAMKKNNSRYSNTAVICLSPFHGGMEMDAVKIAKLISSNINICLITKENSPISTNYIQELEENNIKLKTIDFRSVYSLSIVFGVRKIIKELNIKNVIYLGASELHALFLSFLGLDINLLVRHGTTKTRPKKDFLHRLIYSKVNYHIAICETLANNIKYIIPFGKKTELKVIYSSLRDPINISRQPNTNKNKPIYLLHVGRIIDAKGQKDAVDACEILYEKNIPFELTLLGDFEPGCESSFRAHLNKKQYKNQIHILGFSSNISSYYNNSDIFLFPSKGEGLGNSFIEALSYGLICISYNNTSFPELHNLGFEFYISENLDLETLKITLLDAIKYLGDHKLPLYNNVKLAHSLFCKQNELNEYLTLLK